MANEIKEIGDIVKQCKILLLDIEGTTTSISFVKDKLFPYAEENVQKFLESEWETDDVKEVVTALRKLALEDQENKLEGVVAIPAEDAPKDEQIAGLVSSVKWQMAADRKAGALKQLQGLIWKQGYDNGDIKGHVYDDVASALEQWRSAEGHKVYIYSSGSVQAQKLLFGQSLAGDLLPRIDGHFDSAVGAKQDTASYAAIVSQIEAKPEEILFLTDIVKEAEAARSAGLHAALVSREGNAPLPAAPAFPVIRSLAQLTASNKRKPDQMVEETPAKVPKTEAEKDVKATAETVPVKAAEETKAQEKMEVESENVAPVEQRTEPEKEAVKVVTVIEEITDSKEPVAAPMIDVEPVVEEENKTEEKETESEADKTTNGDADSEPKENAKVTNKDETEPVDEKVSPSGPVIEEIVGDKVEVMDTVDVTPVVEEPPVVEDMDVLQNVGEVLDKECDDILSKVQDVTNLDSIPVKPLLNPIAEETMETENIDSNDIVDRILDTEELEMKQKEILDAAAGENKKIEANSVTLKEANGIDGKATESNGESDKNVDENSIKEVSTEKCSDKESQDKQGETTAVTEKDLHVETIQSESSEKSEEAVVENVKPAEDTKSVSESPIEEVKPVDESSAAEVKVTEESHADDAKTTETSKPEEKTIEPQINGKATNGDSGPNMNGDAAKDEELSSRLAVENGKAAVNGSNGDSTEQGEGDSKVEEVVDIKVKTVAAVEPPAEPIDQPTEA